MTYNNPTPVAVNVVFVQKNDGSFGLLGVERGINPHIGGLAFPGGFVNEMESIEQAAAREFKEEVGIDTDPAQWTLKHSAITPNNRVLVFVMYEGFLTEDDVAKMAPNEEVQSFVILEEGYQLCFPLHQDMMDRCFAAVDAETALAAAAFAS